VRGERKKGGGKAQSTFFPCLDIGCRGDGRDDGKENGRGGKKEGGAFFAVVGFEAVPRDSDFPGGRKKRENALEPWMSGQVWVGKGGKRKKRREKGKYIHKVPG